ncbi:hypothetical protein [Okeania sp. SIO2C2]|nr:hypothetical protein [Okeania sp. SIO2C2]
MGEGRRQETAILETGEMGTSEEVGAGVLSQDCSAQLLTKILNF